ncbi:hypothetical protein [Emcibacter sp.]|uniref:hypothetical protein n=1 Tax=Emcibacter sp. TaxID=1979954 RepID=UPI003A8E5EFF
MSSDVMTATSGLRQPLLGIVATIFLIVISFAVIKFSGSNFATWVAFLFMCCVPAQMLMALAWHTDLPKFASRLAQPLKGLVFLALTMGIGAIVAILSIIVIGKGHTPPTPPLIMYIIFSVVCTFWIMALWRLYPFNRFCKNPMIAGIVGLIAAYVIAWALFVSLFNFSFLAGSPVYIAAQDPGGAFMAWDVLTFAVTTVAAIMMCTLFDFWPVTELNPSGNPLLHGILGSIYVLLIAGAVKYISTQMLGMDQVVYMVTVPISFIFAVFVINVLLEHSLFAGKAQPLKGVLSLAVAIVLTFACKQVYMAAAPMLSGDMLSGPPAYTLDLWIADALLAITFPLIVAFCDYFNFWPFRR